MSTHEVLTPSGDGTTVPGAKGRSWPRSLRTTRIGEGLHRAHRSRLLSFPVMPDGDTRELPAGTRDFVLQDNTSEPQPVVHGAPGRRPVAQRLGIPAILLAADLVAFGGAALAMASSPGPKIFGLLVIVLALFHTAG